MYRALLPSGVGGVRNLQIVINEIVKYKGHCSWTKWEKCWSSKQIRKNSPFMKSPYSRLLTNATNRPAPSKARRLWECKSTTVTLWSDCVTQEWPNLFVKSSFIAGSFLFSKDSAKYDQTLFLLNCFISLKNVPERHFEEHVFSSWISWLFGSAGIVKSRTRGWGALFTMFGQRKVLNSMILESYKKDPKLIT